MEAHELPSLEYGALQQEKRDKLNNRLPLWSLLLALISGFGIASVQDGAISYVVALYPLLAWCIARYAAHSEAVLDQVKAYLLQIEQGLGYQGYEHYNKCHKKDRVSGGHKKALRDAILLTDALAIGAVLIRLLAAGWWPVALVVLLGNLFVIVKTWVCLSERTKRSATSSAR